MEVSYVDHAWSAGRATVWFGSLSSQRCNTLALKQSKQLLHVFFAGAEVDRVDAKPSLSLEFGRRYPELAALLDPLRDFRM